MDRDGYRRAELGFGTRTACYRQRSGANPRSLQRGGFGAIVLYASMDTAARPARNAPAVWIREVATKESTSGSDWGGAYSPIIRAVLLKLEVVKSPTIWGFCS